MKLAIRASAHPPVACSSSQLLAVSMCSFESHTDASGQWDEMIEFTEKVKSGLFGGCCYCSGITHSQPWYQNDSSSGLRTRIPLWQGRQGVVMMLFAC
jgi:hypothetical protein